MSWLNGIVESIVNEISADDAYRRFYSSIPRADYDRILDGDPAPDKFMQFILNCVRDGKDDARDAVDAVQTYKKLSPEIKQRIQMGVKDGQYDSLLDMIYQMKYFAEGGGITSKKQFAKKGYIKIKETDDWIVTCTTNYMASNHYFGDSHWCTASDRMGQYDGYHMFIRYGMESGNVLLQFRTKKKILPPTTTTKGNAFSTGDPYPTEQEEKENAMRFEYQLIQASVDDDGSIGEICDYLDSRIDRLSFAQIIGKEVYESTVKNLEVIKKLLEIQKEQHKDEEPYQESQDDLIRKKKQRKEHQLLAIKHEKDAIAREKEDEEIDRAMEMWNKFLEDKEYDTPEFFDKVLESDGDYKETVDGYKFLRIAGFKDFLGYSFVGLWPMALKTYYVEGVEDEYGNTTNYTVIEEDDPSTIWGRGMINILYDSKTKKVIMAARADDQAGVEVLPMYLDYPATSMEDGFLQISNFGGADYLISAKTKKIYKAEEGMDICGHCERIGDDYIIFCSNYSATILGYIDCKTDELHSLDYDDELFAPIFKMEYLRGGYILRQGELSDHTYRILYYKNGDRDHAAIDITVRLPKHIKGFDGEYTLRQFTLPLGESNIIRLCCTDSDGYNLLNYIFKNRPNETIFGVWGSRASDPRRDIADGELKTSGFGLIDRFHNKDLEKIAYFPETKEYRLYTSKNQPKGEICDKYGKTEADVVAKKNFEKWQAQGGHSPEAKAQMDAMWKDRNGDEEDAYSGKKAMAAWDDADLHKDSEAANGININGFRGKSGVPRFFEPLIGNIGTPDGKKWRGYVGLKDPQGHSDNITKAFMDAQQNSEDPTKIWNNDPPEYIRGNAWYRIGVDGKPLDPTWYEEDEIPANLSDRVVRENKMKNDFNNLQSIMRRMGLID